MISCADFMTELGNYLEGDAAEEIRKQLEAHLAHCQTCRIVLDSTRKTVRIVTDSGSFDLPPGASRPIVAGVMSKIRAARGTENP